MSFDVSADSYLRFMGRYSEPLAVRFADLAGIRDGQRVLDVGCGPGPLTAELAGRLGPAAVSAARKASSWKPVWLSSSIKSSPAALAWPDIF
ncbi:MAG: hypothetical protein WAK82_35905, partial [Streptosporangiaceae bacterium]